MHGIARWGVARSDLIIDDPSLPFRKLNREYKKLRSSVDEAQDDERFWMKETVATRRFELCLEAVLNPYHISGSIKPEREEKPRLNLITTRSQRANIHSNLAQEASSNDEGTERIDASKSTKLELNAPEPERLRCEIAPKKRKKKEQPDATDEKVTLEQLLGFNKVLTSMYLKEYEIYKEDMMGNIKDGQLQTKRRKSLTHGNESMQ